MSNTITKTRVSNAFHAMKAIGISEDKVKPVLKKLVKLYDKNWELIEAENYRALADAIFEGEETEVVEPPQKIESIEKEDVRANILMDVGHAAEHSKKILSNEEGNETEDEAPERPLKRLRRRNQDGQTSSKHTSRVTSIPLIKPKEEPDEFTVVENIKFQTQSPACQSLANNKGKQPITQIPSKERRPVTESSTRDVRPKGPKVGPGIVLSPKQNISTRPVLIKPKDDPITDGGQLLEAHLEAIHPDPLDGGDSLRRDDTVREDNGPEPTLHSVNQLETTDGTTSSNEQRNNDNLTIRSDCNETDGGSHHDVVDIAKGQENLVITLANDFNDESPLFFQYIPKNVIFQDANVNFSLAHIGNSNCCSACLGDCLSSKIPCVCSRETGGEFAYTADGLVKEEFLKESISTNQDPKKHNHFFCKECPVERSKKEDNIEPCKGHLVRKFIKECWLKCGCKKLCGNRVVQRGISRKLQVFMTPEGKGWGLRTLEDLPKGAFICEYVGEVLTTAELFENLLQKPEEQKHSYSVLLDADWSAQKMLKDENALCLDATYYGNVARFINHRCHDSNLVAIPVEVETRDHHYYHHAFFTTREVKAMEELTWDYGIDFDDLDHPIKPFRCQCGSKFCRNIKRLRTRSARR